MNTTKSSKFNRWKTAIVWGANRQFSDPCLDILEKYQIQVRNFVDRTPPSDGQFRGHDVIESSQFLANTALWAGVDVVIFAMLADSVPMQKSLRDLGYVGEFAGYHNGMSETDLFTQNKRLYPKEILFRNHGPQDREVLNSICAQFDGYEKIALYGVDETTQYVLELSEHLSEKVVCIVHSNVNHLNGIQLSKPIVHLSDLPDVDALWITSPEYLINVDATDLLLKMNVDVPVLTWSKLIFDLPENERPHHAFRDTQYNIYPIDIPRIEFDAELDFLLVDLPARFLGMLPNGLGYVHNILSQVDCKFQTVDLDMIFYHRFHSRRLLDAEAELRSPGGNYCQLIRGG